MTVSLFDMYRLIPKRKFLLVYYPLGNTMDILRKKLFKIIRKKFWLNIYMKLKISKSLRKYKSKVVDIPTQVLFML